MGFEQEYWGNKPHRFLTLTTLSMNVSFFNEGQQGHLFVIFIKNNADRRWGNTGYLLDVSSSSRQVKQCNSFSLPPPTGVGAADLKRPICVWYKAFCGYS